MAAVLKFKTALFVYGCAFSSIAFSLSSADEASYHADSEVSYNQGFRTAHSGFEAQQRAGSPYNPGRTDTDNFGFSSPERYDYYPYMDDENYPYGSYPYGEFYYSPHDHHVGSPTPYYHH